MDRRDGHVLGSRVSKIALRGIGAVQHRARGVEKRQGTAVRNSRCAESVALNTASGVEKRQGTTVSKITLHGIDVAEHSERS
jgi:hypothetical protein